MNTTKANQDLRDMMEAAGLTQYVVAAKIGVSYSTINIWLRLPLNRMDPRRTAILTAISMLKKEGAAQHETKEEREPIPGR